MRQSQRFMHKMIEVEHEPLIFVEETLGGAMHDGDFVPESRCILGAQCGVTTRRIGEEHEMPLPLWRRYATRQHAVFPHYRRRDGGTVSAKVAEEVQFVEDIGLGAPVRSIHAQDVHLGIGLR